MTHFSHSYRTTRVTGLAISWVLPAAARHRGYSGREATRRSLPSPLIDATVHAVVVVGANDIARKATVSRHTRKVDRGKMAIVVFGAHVVAVMPNAAARDGAIKALNGSSVYAGMAMGFSESGRPVFAKPITDWAGLTTYLLKEATPQAQYRKGFRRIGGSIALGDRGGDRVILSGDLRDALVRGGKIEPYSRTYAKRLPKAQALLAEIEVRYRDSLFDAEPLTLLAAPRRPKAPPVKRDKIRRHLCRWPIRPRSPTCWPVSHRRIRPLRSASDYQGNRSQTLSPGASVPADRSRAAS